MLLKVVRAKLGFPGRLWTNWDILQNIIQFHKLWWCSIYEQPLVVSLVGVKKGCSVETTLRCEGFVGSALSHPCRREHPGLSGRLPVPSQLFDGKKNLIFTGSVWPLPPPLPYPVDQRILIQAFEQLPKLLSMCQETQCSLEFIFKTNLCQMIVCENECRLE